MRTFMEETAEQDAAIRWGVINAGSKKQAPGARSSRSGATSSVSEQSDEDQRGEENGTPCLSGRATSSILWHRVTLVLRFLTLMLRARFGVAVAERPGAIGSCQDVQRRLLF
jgi:hypothetical protein